MTLVIAHQYGERLAASVAAELPEEVSFHGMEPTPQTAWQVPSEAEVLLVSQDSAAVGLHPNMPEPAGWPFNLRWVHLRSTGIDKYPAWVFAVPKVTVSRGTSAVPISEYVLAAMLSVAKRIPEIWTDARSVWRHHKLGELHGSTLGIIGFGEIGRAVAERALPFGMTVLATRRSPRPSGMDGVEIVSLPDLLGRSDHIALCAPLTPQTRGMLDADAFAALKPGAHLINIGRGAVIDTEALRAALDGPLACATLDVTDPEPPPEGHWLYTHPRVRLSPHISGSSPESNRRTTAFFIANLERFMRGQDLEGVVDPSERY
ncbi:NAD(P)-dependent oxidoreductase [Devosia sp. 1566]|uniref:NAD(P)-dependent oxidoreductase n=1 Tax=Devosia sp. 1566 TaxID=2499144 RepID=UPI000FD70A19|nr:NAD(P)-dependent oxidoreductase [Devosia sp. 1566]